MHTHTFHIWMGVWLLIVPFLGIPGNWRAALTVATALLIIGESLLRHHAERKAIQTDEEKSADAGAERNDNVKAA